VDEEENWRKDPEHEQWRADAVTTLYAVIACIEKPPTNGLHKVQREKAGDLLAELAYCSLPGGSKDCGMQFGWFLVTGETGYENDRKVLDSLLGKDVVRWVKEKGI
jgi:hypothetical protein